jgi:hypothetical protein
MGLDPTSAVVYLRPLGQTRVHICMLRMLDLMNRRIIGIGVAADLVVLGVGFAIVGLNPSETELNVVLVSGMVIGFIVLVLVMDRDFRRRDQRS